jgi:enoyl-CoA hydratase/carnithine racemase
MTDKIQTRRDGGVAWLIFNQPEKRNAMSLDMTVRALEVVQEFAKDDTARVLIVTGAGDRAFVSGADISEFESKRNNAEAAAEYAAISNRMFHAIHDVEKPTIAMIHGFCFGGGVALAAACDMRVCSEDALFSIPAAKLGIGYRVDFTRWIMELVGPAYAKEILYTARRFTAAEAHHMGLVNRVLPKEELQDYVLSDAHLMAENAPLSLKVSKVVVGENLKDPAERDLAKCERAIAACMESDDYKNARRAFMEKRKPVFTGQ